jgi:hypothetical protein
MSKLLPQPTNPPQSRGIEEYWPMSSMSNPKASNYKAPMSSMSSTLNASGFPLASNNVYKTTQKVASTNPFTGQILGVIDYNNGGDGGGGGVQEIQQSQGDQGGGDPNQAYLDFLRAQQEMKMNQIRAKLQAGRDQAGNLVKRTRSYVDDELNPMITRTYEDLMDSARQRGADVETDNRMRARAMNRFGSSAYDQGLVQNTANVANQLADFDVKKATDMRESERLMQDAIEQANQIENASAEQFDYDVGSADNYVASYLDNIIQRNEAMKQLGLGMSDKANSGVQSILSNLFAMGTPATARGVGVQGNPVSPTTYEDILKQRSGLLSSLA